MSQTPPFAGKIALITGATGGIGLETAISLSKLGFEVVIVGRNTHRLQEAMFKVRQASGSDKVAGLAADLSSRAGVNKLAQAFLAHYARLDVLINNAGIWLTSPKSTKEGIEETWAVNHLAMMQLTLLLLPVLERTDNARIVNVSSRIHFRSKLDLEKIANGSPPRGRAAYGPSKLANVLFSYALSRRLSGTSITVNALHPGVVATGLWRNMGWVGKIISWGMVSPQEGALTSVYAATSPDLAHVSGAYLSDSKIVPSSPESQDVQAQETLWEMSLKQLEIQDPFQ